MMIVQIAILLLQTLISTNAQLEVVASWRLATFRPPPGFPGADPNGSPVKIPYLFFTGMQAVKDKLFVSLPRIQPGQPISLGWVPRPPPGQQLPVDTPINAFPDWEWHRAAAQGPKSASANCSGLVSVFRMKLDRCGRLWVIDTGIPEALVAMSHVCQPKLLVFNTTAGQELYRYEFGNEVVHGISLLNNMVLDDQSHPVSSCASIPDNLFLYITDNRSPGIVVFDVQNRAAWRHDPPQAYCHPDWGNYTIAGESFTLMDAILGITLSKSRETLYFSPFASDRIYSVPTSALRARPTPNEDLHIKLVGHTSSQSCPLVLDPSDGTLIISPVTETTIATFHPVTKVVKVKAFDPDLLQGVTDVYLEADQIWAVSTRMQKLFRGSVSAEEANLRILRLAKSSPCNV